MFSHIFAVMQNNLCIEAAWSSTDNAYNGRIVGQSHDVYEAKIRKRRPSVQAAEGANEDESRYRQLIARIDEARRRLGLSERKLCGLAGVPPYAIQTIRRGHAPKLGILRALAGGLGMSEAYLTEVAPEVQSSAPYATEMGVPVSGLAAESDASGVLLGRRAAGYSPRSVPITPAPNGARLGGGEIATEAAPLSLPLVLIEEQLWGKARDFYWAEIVGEAMRPDLGHGDVVLIDRRSTEPVQPGMFAVDDGIGLTARWLEYVPGTEPRQFRMRYSNPRFSSHDVMTDQIRILGRIAWVGRVL